MPDGMMEMGKKALCAPLCDHICDSCLSCFYSCSLPLPLSLSFALSLIGSRFTVFFPYVCFVASNGFCSAFTVSTIILVYIPTYPLVPLASASVV